MTQPQVVEALLFSYEVGVFIESLYHSGGKALFFSQVDSSGFICTVELDGPFCCVSLIPSQTACQQICSRGRQDSYYLAQ